MFKDKGIIFGEHLLFKIDLLKSHGINISLEDVVDIIKKPDKIETGYKNRLIAQKTYDKNRVVRVVYENRPKGIFVVTVYPGKRSRYEKN